MLPWILLAFGVLFTALALITGPRCCCRQPPLALIGAIFLVASLAAAHQLSWWTLYVFGFGLSIAIEIVGVLINAAGDSITAYRKRRRRRPRVPRARARFRS